jgi:hypothetical protein
MRTKSVDVSKWGFNEPVILKTLTFGERCDIEDELLKASGIQIVGESVRGVMKTGFLKTITLEKSIKSAPFPYNRVELGKLDDDLCQYLLKEMDELNGPLVNETKNLSDGP